MTKLISFIIPVYRNQGSIHLVYENVKKLFQSPLSGYNYEFIFIDDGSDDNSINQLIEIFDKDLRVKVISLSRNFGQTVAIIAGLQIAKGDAVINLSADMQEPVELIEKMVREWESGTEIVICYRIGREDTLLVNIASKIFYKLIRVSSTRMPEGGFDFILLDRTAVAELNKIDERNRYYQGDILWLGFNTKFIPYRRLKRTIGKSQWTLSKKLKYFLDGLLNTSYLPIRLMSFVGLFTAVFGFFYALVIVYGRIVHDTPFEGWAPIMILILIIGGLIMLMLGVCGEYIWRIYDEVRKRPQFIKKKEWIH